MFANVPSERARLLASLAAKKIAEYRALLITPRAAAPYLASIAERNAHTLTHAGIAFGVAGEVALARQHFDKVIAQTADDPIEWVGELHQRVSELRDLLEDPAAFRGRIDRDLAAGREQLKLPAHPEGSSGVM